MSKKTVHYFATARTIVQLSNKLFNCPRTKTKSIHSTSVASDSEILDYEHTVTKEQLYLLKVS